MSSGYVLNRSNRTFAEFIAGSVRRDISDARYAHGSGSKANLLRGFSMTTSLSETSLIGITSGEPRLPL
jgi:hypothetical protein